MFRFPNGIQHTTLGHVSEKNRNDLVMKLTTTREDPKKTGCFDLTIHFERKKYAQAVDRSAQRMNVGTVFTPTEQTAAQGRGNQSSPSENDNSDQIEHERQKQTRVDSALDRGERFLCRESGPGKRIDLDRQHDHACN